MTIHDFISVLGKYPWLISGIFAAIPLFTFIYGRIHSKGYGHSSPHKYIYSFIVYLISIPAIFSIMLTLYSLFFVKKNLLHVNVLVYFFPIISFIVTLVLVNKQTDMTRIPGFNRLTGLFAITGVTFLILFILMRTRIWLFFGGSFLSFILMFGALFIFLKWGSAKLIGK